jgi:NAD+ kinase
MRAPTSSRFQRVALVGRYASPGIAEPLSRLAGFLTGRGHAVVLEDETARQTPLPGYPSTPAAALGDVADVAIVIGGDGTMLSIARQVAPFDLPLIGINQGRLGFLTDIPLASMESAVTAMLDGKYVEERRALLDTEVVGGHALALNDVVVNRGAGGSMIEYRVEINGRFVYAMRADALIVATPTGSTAYALSSGGPIIAPDVPAFALVPVAPHALTHRPVAVHDSAVITITLKRGSGASVHCDGQTRFPLAEGNQVTIRRAAFAARFLHPEGYDYFAMLRGKLHWSATFERLHGNP